MTTTNPTNHEAVCQDSRETTSGTNCTPKSSSATPIKKPVQPAPQANVVVGIWSHQEAKQFAVSQLVSSGCGATAAMTVIRCLQPELQLTADQVLQASILRKRAHTAPLLDYLVSRSCAGCTGEEVIESVRLLFTPEHGTQLETHFFSCSKFVDSRHVKFQKLFAPLPERDFELPTLGSPEPNFDHTDVIAWLKQKFETGHCLVATLNLQLFGNDAWHHQFVYAVDTLKRLVYCANPLTCYKEEVFKQLLCTPSVLVVRGEDVIKRNRAEAGDESVLAKPEWQKLDVKKQISRCVEGTKPYILIPACYKGGIAAFRLRQAPNAD